jgi:hypothetical protein
MSLDAPNAVLSSLPLKTPYPPPLTPNAGSLSHKKKPINGVFLRTSYGVLRFPKIFLQGLLLLAACQDARFKNRLGRPQVGLLVPRRGRSLKDGQLPNAPKLLRLRRWRHCPQRRPRHLLRALLWSRLFWETPFSSKLEIKSVLVGVRTALYSSQSKPSLAPTLVFSIMARTSYSRT